MVCGQAELTSGRGSVGSVCVCTGGAEDLVSAAGVETESWRRRPAAAEGSRGVRAGRADVGAGVCRVGVRQHGWEGATH